ncbi:GTPase HflX [Maricaulis maris]|uniref:GTPase HflX n=1 Tax=Maricaulis maris TaxID=74318 RepID=A0A495DM50_9PROT|nr:GTPase HflX [Maricaulis maris]RKR02806.1 GTP-binding protein HflX [Maricaulis maris]
MIEREAPVSRALVIHPASRADMERAEARLEEAAGLAEALDLEVVDASILQIRKIDSGRYFGRGKLAELGEMIADLEANVAVIDTALSPIQQRNLEKAWNVKVIDRTGLILEIFGQRARTKEGVLQVELARLAYERSRLVRTWTHLERQRGGRGFLAGPGETQIETDRRLLNEKMAKLRRQLDEVRRTRALHRSKRQDVPFPTVALVGYTNAGKSTLFNSLTGAGVFAQDMPFATLDPTVRAVDLPGGTRILLSDTVGFITDLPTELIAAFRATLEEVREADLLVHVIDSSDPDRDGRIKDVESVLDAIEAGPAHEQAMLEAWNKADRLDEDGAEDLAITVQMANLKAGRPVKLALSAVTGEGVTVLVEAVERALSRENERLEIRIPPQDARALAWLHAHGDVLASKIDAETGATTMQVRLHPVEAGRFRAQFPELAIPQGIGEVEDEDDF